MTLTKESNKEMEKVMMLMDMGILPIKDKDENPPLTAADVVNCGVTDYLDIDTTDCYELHLTHTHEKNRRAKRRRQMHKHKKAYVNGKTIKAYGKEGKFYLNHNERLLGKKLWINEKSVDEAKEAEILAEAMAEAIAEFEFDQKLKAAMEIKQFYDDFGMGWYEWKKECEVLEMFCDISDKFAERGIFLNGLPSNSIFERFESLEWAKKFKDFLSLEEILDMFF